MKIHSLVCSDVTKLKRQKRKRKVFRIILTGIEMKAKKKNQALENVQSEKDEYRLSSLYYTLIVSIELDQ